MPYICKDDGVIDALTEAMRECLHGHYDEPRDTHVDECLACGRVDDHEQDCPVWAIKRWLKNQGLARAYGAVRAVS